MATRAGLFTAAEIGNFVLTNFDQLSNCQHSDVQIPCLELVTCFYLRFDQNMQQGLQTGAPKHETKRYFAPRPQYPVQSFKSFMAQHAAKTCPMGNLGS